MDGPLCKQCGRAVPKLTRHFGFIPATANRRVNGDRGERCMYLHEDQRPRTKEEAQRYVNEPIISVSKYGQERISSVTTWDGESYVWGGHFHSQTCAAEFGLGMAKQFPTYATDKHRHAVAFRDSLRGRAKEPA